VKLAAPIQSTVLQRRRERQEPKTRSVAGSADSGVHCIVYSILHFSGKQTSGRGWRDEVESSRDRE
jgi:hypothetical protein